MICSSSTSSRGSLLDLMESQADGVLYAYGSGMGVEHQESPPYMLELARNDPKKKYEMIHLDPSFRLYISQGAQGPNYPHCMRSGDWKWSKQKVADVYLAQHKQWKNLTIRLISRAFPDVSDQEFCEGFKKYIQGKLSQSAEVFLGVHNACWADLWCSLGETFNQLRQFFPRQIHFYVQAAARPAFIYKGPYSTAFGLCASHVFHKMNGGWDSFRRVFSQAKPEAEDRQKVDACMRDYLKTPLESEFHNQPSEEERKHLPRYLECPSEYRVLALPLQLVTPEIWNSLAGQEPLPSPEAIAQADSLKSRQVRDREENKSGDSPDERPKEVQKRAPFSFRSFGKALAARFQKSKY